MKKLSHSEGIEILDQCIGLFEKFEFEQSAKEVLKIKKELTSSKDFTSLNLSYKVLQTIFINEFNTTSHRTLCSTFFKKRVNLTMKLNISELNKMFSNDGWGKMIGYRVKSRNVLFTLDKILKKGSSSKEDASVSVSYLYLASIDGVYGKNLKDIVIFDILSKGGLVNYSTIEKMNLRRIEQHLEKIRDSDCLFDGWDDEIRNSIAHSSFWYDSKKDRIIYEERYQGIVKEKTIDEMIDMLKKLSDIDQLVFFYNQIHRINKVIMDLK